jgi:hypothetical protein
MSLTVCRFLGYGLTDVANQDMRITDPRINSGSWLLTHDGVPGLADYLAWLEDRRDGLKFSLDYAHLKQLPEGPGLDYCAVYSPEYGMPNVLALRPYGCADWSRRDDPIDYAQETWLMPECQRNRADVMPLAGIYPFVGVYMDARTGRRLDDSIMWWVRLCNDAACERGEPEREQALELLARQAGFACHVEAAGNVAPEVPGEIKDLAEFAQLFTDETVWRQLRPLLYTYWA